MSFVKLENLYYLGRSKKHEIFRSKNWNRDLEKVLKKPVYDENYEEIGRVKDIFGPVELPFISIKTNPNQVMDFENKSSISLYAKITKKRR